MTDSQPEGPVLAALTQVLEARKLAPAESSYVASLYHKGFNKILEKVGEECTEVLIAAKDAERAADNRALINETADLWFHTLVMLAARGESARPVIAELERRFGLSGLEEKAARQSSLTTDGK